MRNRSDHRERAREDTLISHTDQRRSLYAACVAELLWLDPAGQPQARAVTPLVLRGQPAVALPYAQAELARTIAAAPAVSLVLSDDRLASGGWRPVALTGRPRLAADPGGDLFTEHLLDQELRKYPPARALVDSPLLRREHWWYLPRLIVTVEVESVVPVGARAGGAGEVLALITSDGQLYVDTVRAGGQEAGRRRIESLAGRLAGDGPAVLFGHDFSSDLECWTPWTTRGRLAAATLAVEQAPRQTTLEPPPRLWQRLRRQWQLERDCRRGLAELS